ncbi:MAG: hypothetical protein WA667_06800 [Candidatus Nitrosopolaris sp.]
MFDSKTTKIVKTRKKNIGGFLAMLFCTLVIVSTIGNSFGIRNSFAQEQQLQTQPPSTITYKSPLSNEMPINSVSNQPLCKASTCNQSSDPSNKTTQTNSVDPTTQLSHLLFTNSKTLDLTHSFVSNKVIGPDRFRFVNYYWNYR